MYMYVKRPSRQVERQTAIRQIDREVDRKRQTVKQRDD